MRAVRELVLLVALVGCSADSSKPFDASPTTPDGSGGTQPDGAPGGPNSCLARDCGSDGAGGSCGDCGSTFACDDTLGLCIPNNGADVGVEFQGACWYLCPSGATYCTPGARYQGMELQLQAAYPVEATLYFDHDCNPLDGTDNLNDTGAATPTQIGIEWFIHHPDERPSSGVWWAGHHSSGCVDYTSAPDCQ